MNWCVVGIPLFMNTKKLKTEYQQNDCCEYSVFKVFLFINSGIPTAHVINVTVVVGIIFTALYTCVYEYWKRRYGFGCENMD